MAKRRKFSKAFKSQVVEALCHSKWVTKEKGANAKTRTEVQNCFTTKEEEEEEEEEEDKALDLAW